MFNRKEINDDAMFTIEYSSQNEIEPSRVSGIIFVYVWIEKVTCIVIDNDN